MNDRTGRTGRTDIQEWDGVLDFWFPEGRRMDVDAEVHHDWWSWRMRGGADRAIEARFSDLTLKGAKGDLAHWASDADGRLALIIVLDQFSRSLWRDTARAFAQDATALSLAMGGLSNGHYAALATPWFKVAHALPLGHCEGPDHLERLDLLIELRTDILARAPARLRPIYSLLVNQAHDVRKVVAAFGRHPHRNRILRRPSTPAEEEYIAKGRFPHLKAFTDSGASKAAAQTPRD